jgi:hypothetical protein
MGRVSRRSEISKEDGLTVGRGTSYLDGIGLATQSVVLAFLVEAFLAAAVTSDTGVLHLVAFLLVLANGAFLEASVISVGVGFRVRAALSLAIRSPRST